MQQFPCASPFCQKAIVGSPAKTTSGQRRGGATTLVLTERSDRPFSSGFRVPSSMFRVFNTLLCVYKLGTRNTEPAYRPQAVSKLLIGMMFSSFLQNNSSPKHIKQ